MNLDWLYNRLKRRTLPRFLVGLLFLLTSSPISLVLAQSVQPDSSKSHRVSPKDTIYESRNSGLNPRKASLLSAVFPGAGQLYNGKYWKLPVLYGGAFALGYYIDLNNQQYTLFRDAYLIRKSGKEDVFKGRFNEEQLVRQREYWRRNRDLLIILSAFTYLLNIADAAVDAHLSEFDVSDNLSISVMPKVEVCQRKPFVGMGMVVSLH